MKIDYIFDGTNIAHFAIDVEIDSGAIDEYVDVNTRRQAALENTLS